MALLRTVIAGLSPSPDQGREWLHRELAKPAYHRSLVDRFFSWLGDLWHALQRTALDATPLSTAALVLVAAVLTLAVVLLVSRARFEPVSRRDPGGAALDPGSVSPDEHRANAAAALEDGRLEVAVVEAFRALATRSARRGVLEERVGLTAREVALALGPAFPDRADDLVSAAAGFDLVFYGHEAATVEAARGILDLDEELRSARPRRGSALDERSVASAVPR